MPKIPTADAKRPDLQPSSGIASYNPVDPRDPKLREPVGDLGAPDKAREALGTAEIGLGGTLGGMGAQEQARQDAERRRLEIAAEHEQARQDTLRAEDAYNTLRNRQLDLTIGEGGYATLKGAAAVNQPVLKTYTEQFDQSAQELAQGLQNDEQRSLFSRRAAVASLQMKEGILQHVIREGDTYATEVFNGIVATETRQAVANWASPEDVKASLARVNAAVKERADRGSWPAQYAEATRLKEDGAIHAAVIDQAIAEGNLAYAQQWYEANKADIDKTTAVRLEKAVQDGTQRQAVAGYTSMLLQAKGASSLPALDELDRRVTADRVLDDTRRNALLGQVAGAREKITNSIDRQDLKNERARDRFEKQIERGINQVRGMLPYGEPTMAQIEPLINAAKGTAMEGEVAGLVAMSNATRKFRFAPAIEQEAMLSRWRGVAREDPTKVDAQMLNTLQGIYDGQQRQLKESGIKFVVSQGLVSPDNPAVKPIDVTKPDTMATLPQRLQLARAVTDQYGAPMKPLTPEEGDVFKAALAAGNTTQRRDLFAKIAQAAGTDYRGYNAIVAQVAPDQPVLAIAGIAANRRYDDGHGKLVADLMLRGQEVLNPPKGADGRPDQGKLLPMPAEQKMRLDFDNYVRDAYAGNPQGRSDYFQAAKAIYAARSVDAGDKDTTVLDGSRWQESIKLATGGIETYNGKRTVLPWGMDVGKFRDGLSDRVNLLGTSGRLPAGITPGKLRDLPLEPVGDGRYVFRSGDSVIVEKLTPQPGAPWRFVQSLGMKRVDTPAEGKGYAETWPAGEGGTPEMPRPKEIPIDQHGIQVFKPDKWTENDTAGEALHIDPVARQYNKRFAATLSDAQKAELKRQPDYTFPGNEGPERRMENAVDAAMRGYLVGQWPAKAVQDFFTPKQREMLDELKVYMQTGTTNATRPIVIDFNQALPYYPSGYNRAAAEAQPTQAELDAAAASARGARRK